MRSGELGAEGGAGEGRARGRGASASEGASEHLPWAKEVATGSKLEGRGNCLLIFFRNSFFPPLRSVRW